MNKKKRSKKYSNGGKFKLNPEEDCERENHTKETKKKEEIEALRHFIWYT